MDVVILDTGCANLFSVKAAVKRLGYEPVVSRDSDIVLKADKLFLPGVGTAQAAMDQIIERDLVDLIKACTQPVLGICLGMQLLASSSEESGGIATLGIVEQNVIKMPERGLPLPHMGWNQVSAKAGHHLFRGIDENAYFILCTATPCRCVKTPLRRRCTAIPLPRPCRKIISSASSSTPNVRVPQARSC